MRWRLGYPCDTNSIDSADSARLAGLMALFNHPEQVPLDGYYQEDPIRGWVYLRHPIDKNKYPMSRDNLVPLLAGYKAQGKSMWVDPNYRPDSRDIISLSVLDHMVICAGGKPSILGQANLWFDVLWSCFVDPMAEPNQILSMMMVHPNKAYIKFWKRFNIKWREAIWEYWFTKHKDKYNRGEGELASLMVQRITNLK